MNIPELVQQMAREAKGAARHLGMLSREVKDRIILRVAELLQERQARIQTANRLDVEAARAQGLAAAFIDRLTLSDKVIASMIKGLKEVAALPDPVGAVTGMWVRPNGLKVGRQRIALGVIGFIYESRPNVTVDAAALCLKSGNSVILKGGKEALNSNLALAQVMQDALAAAGVPQGAVQVIPSVAREATLELLKQDDLVDLIIPRGGEGLIRFVAEHSRIPVLKHYKGVCHIFVDESADLDMAEEVCFNAKVQRPGVCNALETLLVHEDIAGEFLPEAAQALEMGECELRGCPHTRQIIPCKEATDEDWTTEYLDKILSIKVVESLDAAIEHINRYGSHHSDSIVTERYEAAERFLDEVDSAAVYVNASTRFTDGFEFGLGAEIGISTNKLHCRGPMALQELTCLKYIIRGSGQIRE